MANKPRLLGEFYLQTRGIWYLLKWHPDLLAAGLGTDPAPTEEHAPDPEADRGMQSGPKRPQTFLTSKETRQV